MILYFDIETVSGKEHLRELSEPMQELWHKKVNRDGELSLEEVESLYREKAALYAEFGKICCISIGRKDGETKSLVGSESEILTEFKSVVEKMSQQRDQICGHNIKNFDIPYLCRRYKLNGMYIPNFINITGKKPWEMGFLVDTMEMWGFGQWKYSISLDLLCNLFDIPTPKDDIDGSQVTPLFYSGEIDRIAEYCEKDVKACVELHNKLL